MAEARRGVVPLPALGLHEARPNFTSHRIQVALDQNGVVVFIPHIRFLFRNVLRTLWRTRNKIRDACFPLPAWFVISFSVGAASLTIQAGTQNDSTVCSKSSQNTPWRHLLRCIQIPFASIIVHSIKPLTHSVPEALQSGAIGFSLSALYLYVFSVSQRFIIRSLLTYDDWIFEVRKKMSVKTKLWAFLLKHIYVHPKRVLLLTFQNCLPTQPLPALDTTVQQYLESIEPLVNAQEFNTLRIQARRFVDEEGKTLQRYLKFKHFLSRNYVSEWWLNLVYLRSRSSLTINSNYYGMTAAYGAPTPHQVSRAAVVIHNLVRVKLQIDHETLLPQCIQGFMPICMDQHIHAFSSVREPHQEQDKLVQYDSLESRHVLVIHRGRMYTVSCFSDRSRRPLTCKQLETTLRGIVEDPTEPSPVEAAIPILTSLDRATWAQIRERFFQQDAVNESALEKIERALFVVCLDDCAPKNWLEEGRNLFIGDYGKNRWADKSFNLVVTSNAKVGIEAEHSWGDAVTMSYLLEVAFIEEIRARPYERDGSVRRVARDIQKGDKTQYPARRVQFNVTDELAAVIRSAVPSVQKELSDLDLAVDVFTDYGKEVIKRTKCSPDGWIQMALQLAYYRDQHKFDQTYESTTLRRFYMGRTETIRSVSKASCAFVLAMEDPTVPRSEVARLLQVACEQHQTTSRLAFLGRGVDRHLFALYVVSVGMGIQSPFLKAFLSRKWSLSTSQTPLRQTMVGTWPLNDQGNRFPSPCGGFAPVTDDGYGVSYTVAGDYRLFFHVSAKHSAENTDAKRFFDRIMVALGEMRALFPEVPDVPLPAEFDMAYDAYICLDDCIPFDYK